MARPLRLRRVRWDRPGGGRSRSSADMLRSGTVVPMQGAGDGSVIRVVRIVGVLEPGGAQLSALRLSRALAGFGIDSSLLLAGDATAAGIGLARRYRVAIEAFSPGEHRRPQWAPDAAFVALPRPPVGRGDPVPAPHIR